VIKYILDHVAYPVGDVFSFISFAVESDQNLYLQSEMVIYEAAHAIVNMKRTTSRELAPAVSVLQLFCSSPKPTLRFAAVRTLNKVAMTHPAAVTACNLDLENLITGTVSPIHASSLWQDQFIPFSHTIIAVWKGRL
jgi:hypothetical protein